MDPDGTVRLVGAIVRGTPSLPGAACRGRYGLFDDKVDGETPQQRQQRYETAVMTCRGCPARPACSESPSARSRWGGIAVQAGRVLS